MGKLINALHTKMASAKRLSKIASAKQIIKTAEAFKIVIGVLEKNAISPEMAHSLRYMATRVGGPALGGSMVGAPVGAIAGGEGHRMEGAAKGAVGGAIGGVAAQELSRILAAKGLLGAGMKHQMGNVDKMTHAVADGAGSAMNEGLRQVGEQMSGAAPRPSRGAMGANAALSLGATGGGGYMAGSTANKKPAEKKEPKEEKSEDSEE